MTRRKLTSKLLNMTDEAPTMDSAPAKVKLHAGRGKRVLIRPRHRELLAELQKPEHKGQITKAMIALSFAPQVINSPKKVTETKSWLALMDESLPEDIVAERHRELLDKRDTMTYVTGRGKNRKVVSHDLGVNVPAVGKALELAYKLRGRMAGEAPPGGNMNVYNLFFNPNVQAQVKTFEDNLKTAIAGEVVSVKSNEVKDPTNETSEGDKPDTDITAGSDRPNTGAVEAVS